jgi:histidinol phosphatase-like PHP family hydrolase
MSEKTFFLYDLHMRTSANQNVQDMVNKANTSGFVSIGILYNMSPTGIETNDDLQKFINGVKNYPCYMGLKPAAPGWSKNLSKELIDQVDYVLMAPQYMPDGNKYGDRMEVKDFNCYVDDPEDFMKRNVEWYLKILNHEDDPLDILGWPLFLPPSIQREYYLLWNQERMEQIIESARKNHVALEINDLAHTPHAEFILMAKKAGVKFTFGSDTAGDQRSFRLDYCKEVATLCNLTEDDFFVPVRKPRK